MSTIEIRQFHGWLRQRMRPVEAELNWDAHPGILDELERQWTWSRRLMKLKSMLMFRRLDHQHWDWRHKRIERGVQTHQFVTLEHDSIIQGAMAIDRTIRKSKRDSRMLLHVDFLETAPWNQTALPLMTQFGAVGSSLIRAAIQLSRQADCRGRIGLHSLPNAEGFYRKLGFSFLEYDPLYQHLAYFEYDGEREDFS